MKKLILLDMDGTIYLGNQLFDGVKECFDYFKKHDIKFVFITNNSSHDLEFYISKVNSMGIECNEENFYSSIEVTLEYLTKRNAKKIYVLGNECLNICLLLSADLHILLLCQNTFIIIISHTHSKSLGDFLV